MSETQTNELPPIKKNALDEVKLRLTGDPEQGNRPPSLAVSVLMNQPRLTVFTNVQNDKDNGIIRAPMDSNTMYALLTLLEEVINHDGQIRYSVDNLTGHPNDKRLLSTTYVGKDEQGCVYISVLSADKDRPRLRFIFRPSQYHHLKSADGNELPMSKLSVIYAKSWLELMRNLVANVLNGEYVVPQRPEGGRQGSGYQNKGNYQNKGGYQNRQGSGYQNKGNYQNRQGGGYQNKGNYQNRQGGGGYQNNNSGGYNKPAAEPNVEMSDDFPM